MVCLSWCRAKFGNMHTLATCFFFEVGVATSSKYCGGMGTDGRFLLNGWNLARFDSRKCGSLMGIRACRKQSFGPAHSIRGHRRKLGQEVQALSTLHETGGK